MADQIDGDLLELKDLGLSLGQVSNLVRDGGVITSIPPSIPIYNFQGQVVGIIRKRADLQQWITDYKGKLEERRLPSPQPITQKAAQALVTNLWLTLDGGHCVSCAGEAVEALLVAIPHIDWKGILEVVLNG